MIDDDYLFFFSIFFQMKDEMKTPHLGKTPNKEALYIRLD